MEEPKNNNNDDVEKGSSAWKRIKECPEIATGYLEAGFEGFGALVAKRPWLSIFMSLMLCLVCSSGFIFWQEDKGDEFWTPFGSPIIAQRKWILHNFPRDTRYETLLITSENGENILTAANLMLLSDLHSSTLAIQSMEGQTYNDLCVKLTSVLEPGRKRCATSSLLNLWEFNGTLISQLSESDILDAVTTSLADTPNLKPIDRIDQLLSGVEFDASSGQVTKATGILNIWLVKQNGTKIADGDVVDENVLDWEKKFIKKVINLPESELPENVTLCGLAERSYNDGVDESVNSNFAMMFGGFTLIFFYVCVTLGRWNAVEQRVVLALMGIMVIVMSLACAFGLCFYFGLAFGELHSSIPFLLLGIGVDDMYVIVQALDNLSAEEKGLSLHKRIGKAMKHAGVSVTVTSVTDMAAFFIGSSSSLPIMRSFCLFAAMGVLFLYIFAITFFVGCVTLDERRIDAKKVCNFGCLPAMSKDWKPSTNEVIRDPGKVFFANILAPFLSDIKVKIAVIFVTMTMLGFGIYGALNIKLDFDPIWFMDQSSYQTKYFKKLQQAFPEQGERIEVYMGALPYWKQREQLLQIEEVLRSSEYINHESISFWHTEFHDACCAGIDNNKEYCIDMLDFKGEQTCEDELSFKRRLLLFLQENQFYIPDFRFNISLGDLTEDDMYDLYDQGNFQIIASRAKFQHNSLQNTSMRIKAMEEVKEGLAAIKFDLPTEDMPDENFLPSPIAYSYVYMQWEANETISKELIRNLGITFATVGIVSLILIMNLQISLMVFLSVVFSVVNVGGYAHFCGLTIEMVTSITLILTVGLALDYAAHVGVIFSCFKAGSREEKMKKSLEDIGPAVLNGGISTFLAFLLLGFSDAYAFNTFFTMFSMVVFFGLFHGLIFLPVLLSFIGPSESKDEKK